MVTTKHTVEGFDVEIKVNEEGGQTIRIEMDSVGEEDITALSVATGLQMLDGLIREGEESLNRLRALRSALPNLGEIADRAFKIVSGEAAT